MTTDEKPSWYKFARFNIQSAYDWLALQDAELAAWWDGGSCHVHSKFLWGLPLGPVDLEVEFCNKNGQKRQLSFKIVEIEHEGVVDEKGV